MPGAPSPPIDYTTESPNRQEKRRRGTRPVHPKFQPSDQGVDQLMQLEQYIEARLKAREKDGPPVTSKEQVGFNGRIAVLITNGVGTMWCAYVFAGLALISLPSAIAGGISTLVSWTAQTFLQLVLLSVIMVGQKVAAAASDKQALQTYEDAETMLKMQAELQQLIQINTTMLQEVHAAVLKQEGSAPH
jgi:sensor histidine kinase YesM